MCLVNWGILALLSEGWTTGCWHLAWTQAPRAQTVQWVAHAIRRVQLPVWPPALVVPQFPLLRTRPVIVLLRLGALT